MNNNINTVQFPFTNDDIDIHVEKYNKRHIKSKYSTLVFGFGLSGLSLVLILLQLFISKQINNLSKEYDLMSFEHNVLLNTTKTLKTKILRTETNIVNLKLKGITYNQDSSIIKNVSSYIIANKQKLVNKYQTLKSNLDLAKTKNKDVKKKTFQNSLSLTSNQLQVSNKIFQHSELINKAKKLKDMISTGNSDMKPNPKPIEPMFINSVIITEKRQFFDLRSYLTQDNGDAFGLTLKYRSSRDGDDIQSFRNKCSTSTKTVIVIRNFSGCIYGGYTNQLWKGKGFKKDSEAFLFNLSYQKKFKIKNDLITEAIYINNDIILQFGNEDLIIKPFRRAFSDFPRTYGEGIPKSFLMCGEHDSYIQEMEVFSLFKDDIM